MRADVLVLGQGPSLPDFDPPPEPADLRETPFPVQRLWQGVRALVAGGMDVAVAAEGPGAPGWRALRGPGGMRVRWRSLPAGDLDAARPAALVEALNPRCVVTLGPFAPARWGASLPDGIPALIDLPGDPMAEAQLRAEDGEAHRLAYREVLLGALLRGDAFTACSRPQRLALLGQLGLTGRLHPADLDAEPPVYAIPPTLDPAWSGPAAPRVGAALPPGPHVALIGSTNTWLDVDATLDALDEALPKAPGARVVIVGGAVYGFNEARHARLLDALSQRPWASRVHAPGWIEPEALKATLDACTAALCLDRRCPEAELGARTRLLVGIARGLRWVVTPTTEMAQHLVASGLGLAAPHGDGRAAGRALLDALKAGRLSEADRARWEAIVPGADGEALVRWASAPRRLAPPPAGWLDGETRRRLDLERELAALRGSPTWKLLNTLHRKGLRGGRR